MSTTLLVVLLIVVVALVLGFARGLDARAARRHRRTSDVAGAYLAEAGPPTTSATQPLPRWVTVAVMLAAGGGLVGAGVGVAGAWADEAQERSDEISGCRSSFNIELLSGPQAGGLAALADTGDLRSAEFRSAIADLDVERMKKLSAFARTDPDEFLRICRTEQPA